MKHLDLPDPAAPPSAERAPRGPVPVRPGLLSAPLRPLHGNVPLALTQLIAGVGVAVLGMAVGAARTRLHRLARRHR